jgi:tetratricopeptide (TPR) repeat protein
MGILYRDHINDEDKCMDAVQAGKKLITEEYRRVLTSSSSAIVSQRERLEKDYLQAINDLHTLELETLLKSQTKIAEAQAVFKSELKQNPGDVNLMIAYASLFEKTDAGVAIEYYKKALEKDPGNAIAEFNLGVVYYNQGQKYFDQGVRAEDEDKQDVNVAKAREYFKLARPVFEKVLESNPDDQDAIAAMQLICFALDDFEGYQFYSDKLKTIEN